MITIGRYEIRSVVAGTLRLDGGAMFGVVPKVLWQNVADVDDSNRILLATRVLIAVDREAGRTILVDSGCGSKWDARGAQRYAIHYDETAVPNALESMGLGVGDVTDVIITHLHFDHSGGLTEWYDQPGGPTQLRYPKARHWIHKKHWEHANNPSPKDSGSFVPEDFSLLADKGVLCWIEGDNPPSEIPGVEWFVSHGHTPGQLHPRFTGVGSSLLFVGDLTPTVAHLRLSWLMAFDVEPLVTIREKTGVLRKCIDDSLMLAFPHDPTVGGVMIDGTIERPIVSRTLDLD